MLWLLAAQCRAVLISSHALAKVAQTVDDVVAINGGRCVAQATLDDLAAAHPCRRLAMTSEFRNKTIVPAVLLTPRSGRVLAAKVVTLTGAGLVFGLAASGIAAAITLPVLAARHIGSGIDGAQLAAITAGGGAAAAISAAIGIGVGAVIRNQVGAIIALLSLLYVAEPLLRFIPRAGTAVQVYGLGGLASGATGTTGFPATTRLLAQAPATAVLASYALAVVLAGAALLRHRDITA